jgi:hypothetical protein
MKHIKTILALALLAIGLSTAHAQYSGQITVTMPATVTALSQSNIYQWVDCTDSQTVALMGVGKGGASSAITTMCGWSLDRNTNHIYNTFALSVTPTGTTNTTYGTNLTSGAQGYVCVMYQTNAHATVTWTNDQSAIYWSQKRFRP